MNVIIRLQNLPWSANAADIRQYFKGLQIPEGGVHIVGGDNGDAFIAFSSDEDARQAMSLNGGKIKEVKVSLLLSSRAEMQKVIEKARAASAFLTTKMAQQLPSAEAITNQFVKKLPESTVTTTKVQTQAYMATNYMQQSAAPAVAPMMNYQRNAVGLNNQVTNLAGNAANLNANTANLGQNAMNLGTNPAAQMALPYGITNTQDYIKYMTMTNAAGGYQIDTNQLRNLYNTDKKIDAGNYQMLQQQSRERQRSRSPVSSSSSSKYDDKKDRKRRTRFSSPEKTASVSSNNPLIGAHNPLMQMQQSGNSFMQQQTNNLIQQQPNPLMQQQTGSSLMQQTGSSLMQPGNSLMQQQHPGNQLMHQQNPLMQSAIQNPLLSMQQQQLISKQAYDIPMTINNLITASLPIVTNANNAKLSNGIWDVPPMNLNNYSNNKPSNNYNTTNSQFLNNNSNQGGLEIGTCIKVSNIDKDTGYGDIRKFFGGLPIGSNDIKFLKDNMGDPTGVALIRFLSPDSKKQAMTKNGWQLNSTQVMIMSISEDDYENNLDGNRSRGRDNYRSSHKRSYEESRNDRFRDRSDSRERNYDSRRDRDRDRERDRRGRDDRDRDYGNNNNFNNNNRNMSNSYTNRDNFHQNNMNNNRFANTNSNVSGGRYDRDRERGNFNNNFNRNNNSNNFNNRRDFRRDNDGPRGYNRGNFRDQHYDECEEKIEYIPDENFTVLVIDDIPDKNEADLFESFPDILGITIDKYTAYCKFRTHEAAKAVLENRFLHYIRNKRVFVEKGSELQFDDVVKKCGKFDNPEFKGETNATNSVDSGNKNEENNKNSNNENYNNDKMEIIEENSNEQNEAAENSNSTNSRDEQEQRRDDDQKSYQDDEDSRQEVQNRRPEDDQQSRPTNTFGSRDPRQKMQQNDRGSANSQQNNPLSQIKTDCILIKNLDLQTTLEDIEAFFSDLNIQRNQMRIHILLDKRGQPCGDCFIEFKFENDVQRALNKNNQELGPNRVQIMPIPREQVQAVLHSFGDDTNRPQQQNRGPPPLMPPRENNWAPPSDFGNPGCVVMVSNLTYRATVDDILDEFREFDLKPDQLIRRFNDFGRPTGNACINFNSPADAAKACNEYNNIRILNRNIWLRRV